MVITIEIHFLSSLAWNVFAQHMLRYFVRPRWHGMGFLNTR
jgi:hypothetical protein